jgi:hypothetical protein
MLVLGKILIADAILTALLIFLLVALLRSKRF